MSRESLQSHFLLLSLLLFHVVDTVQREPCFNGERSLMFPQFLSFNRKVEGIRVDFTFNQIFLLENPGNCGVIT